LPPPSWENVSPHAAFAPLHARLIGGPHMSSNSSSPPEYGHTATASHHLRPPFSTSRCRPRVVTSPHHQSPLNPSLSHPTFNGVKAITADRFSASPGRSPPLGPYKRARSTPGHHHTHPRPPLLALESATPTSTSTDRRRPFLSTTPPFPHLLSSDEPINVLTVTVTASTSPAPSLATLSPGVVGGRAPVSS
jgi:hypothetical protein